MTIVSNASPSIALEKISKLDLMHQLFFQVLIPPAVFREVKLSGGKPKWIVVQALSHAVDSTRISNSLGDGERETIALALEVATTTVILDDLAARRIAIQLGLTITGTIGILVAAKKHGLIREIRPEFDALVRSGFHISNQLYRRALTLTGELPP